MSVIEHEVSRIPATLRMPLKVVAARSRAVGFLEALAVSLVCLLMLTLAAVIALALIPNLSGGGRISLLGVTFAIWLAATAYAFRRGLRATSLPRAARKMELTFPTLEERVSSAVELSEEKNDAFRGSPELLARLIEEAQLQIGAIDAGEVVSGKRALVFGGGVLGMMIVWLVVAAAVPGVIKAGFQRAIAPWQKVVAATAGLTVTPGDVTVVTGRPLAIHADVVLPPNQKNHESGAKITLTFPNRQTIAADMLPDAAGRGLDYRIDAVAQNFTYQVAAGGTISPVYRVNVVEQPRLTGMEIAYAYPRYTHLANRSESSRDGTIDALVGTHITLTLHVSQEISDRSVLLLGDKGEVTPPISPTSDPLVYNAKFIASTSQPYHVLLVSAKNTVKKDGVDQPVTNAGDVARAIIARPDLAPTVLVSWPGDGISVRPDDTVPVRFEAADDFGISKIEALVQVDDGTPRTVDISAPDLGGKRVAGVYRLALDRLLMGVTATGTMPSHITYQLRATDNMEPAGQVGLSGRQTLRLDPAAPTMAALEQERAASELAQTLDSSRQRITAARQTLEDLKGLNRPLTVEERKRTDAAREQLSQAADALKTQAAQKSGSAFRDVAKAMRDVADRQVTPAAEKASQAALADGQKEQQQGVTEGARNAASAEEKIAALQEQLHREARARSLAQDLTDLSRRQDDVSQGLATATGAERQKLLAQQAAIRQKAEQLVSHDTKLQEAVNKEAQARADAVNRQLEEPARQQQALTDQATERGENAKALDRLDELADQQAQLNKKVDALNRDHGDAIKKAGAAPPRTEQMDSIVKDLHRKQLDAAANQQRAAVRNLQQAADRLAQQENMNGTAGADVSPEDVRRNAEQARQAAQNAEQLGKQIADAKAANNPPTLPSDPANQQAKAQAQDVDRAAQEMAARDARLKEAAAAAQRYAAAAKAAAEAGQAQQAQEKLASATQKLAQATKEQQAKAEGRAAASPAQQAKALAQEQQGLAEQTNRAMEAAKARGDPSQQAQAADAQKKSEQVAQQLEQAAQQAQAISQQTQKTSPEVSRKADAAAQSFKEAAREQRAAGQRADDPASAQEHQEAAARKAQEGREALRQLTQSQPQQGNPSASKNTAANSTPQQTGSQQAGGQKSSDHATSSASASQQQGTSSAPDANASGSGQKNDPAGGSQSQGASSSNPGSAAGSGTSGSASGGQQSGGTPGQSTASQSSSTGSTAQAGGGTTPGSGTETAPSSAASGNTPGTAGNPSEEIAHAIDEQRKAADGDPLAAKHAAQALARAAEIARRGAGDNPSPNGSSDNSTASGDSATSSPSAQPASGTGSGYGPANPLATGGSGNGVSPGTPLPATPTDVRPAAVKDIGIPPSDWARLPAGMQQQLLNAAQQKGPAEYQDMIRNYYLRIARLTADQATPDGANK